jgi:hypothetical protein
MKGRLAHPFGAVTAAYIAVVLVLGFTTLEWDPPHRWYVASHLPHNHRILPEDLGEPGTFAGRLGFYLADRKVLEGKFVGAISAGGRLVELKGVPDLGVPAGYRLVEFSLASQFRLARWLEVDTPVVLLAAQDATTKKPVLVRAKVQSIACEPPKDAKSSETCYALLAVPECDEENVKKNLANLRMVPDVPVHR